MESRRRKLALDNGVLVVDGEIVSRSPSNVPPTAGLRAGGGAGPALPVPNVPPRPGPAAYADKFVWSRSARYCAVGQVSQGPQGASPESVPKREGFANRRLR